MKEFTQTTFGAVGNCWQTAVACLLDVDPSTLPDQSKCDLRGPDGYRTEPFFQNLLNTYLYKHHGLIYTEISTPGLSELLTVRDPGWHFLTGTTERTGTPGGAERHVVVARYGKMVWDPHPSRAGLLDAINIALLIPMPAEWEQTWSGYTCGCPNCVVV